MKPEDEGGFFSKFKTTQGSSSVPNGTGQYDSSLMPLSGNEHAAPAPVPQAAPFQGSPVLPPAPAAPAHAENGKIAALEAAMNELKEELAALKGAARPDSSAQSLEAPAGLAVRMERSENLIAELKVLVSSQQAQLNKYAEAKLVAEGLSEYLRDLVAQLNTKLVEAVNTMHLSLSDMSARLTGSEAIHKKMFSDAEDRVKKSLGGEMAAMDAQLKKLREDVSWLSDEYKILMTGKISALEEKYSAAFEAIARRMAK